MSAAAGKTARRVAILVIHGIGEQQPYEALDAFGRGLAEQFKIRAGQLEHHLAWRAGKAYSLVRTPLPAASPVPELDLYEFCWAPLVQGRIRLRQVLAWIVRTSLTPLRSMAQQWEVLSQEPGARRRQWWMALREVLRAGGLFLLALVILLPFVVAAVQRQVLMDAGWRAFGTIKQVEHPLALGVFALLVLFALTILWGWRRVIPLKRYGRDIEATSERRWRWYSLGWALALLGLAWGVQAGVGLPVGGLVRRLWTSLWGWPLAVVAMVLVAWILSRPLVKYLGDVTLYVTADENSAFFRTRTDILKASTDRVRLLLTDQGYEGVYVAGHSLGSVIAYDTINHLIREATAEPPEGGKLSVAQLERLQGLLTFGSPLDKVNYFFRIKVARDQAIRAQVLSLLHGFRKKSSSRTYEDLTFTTPKFSGLKALRWLNVYSRLDFVSGKLDFYEVDQQKHLAYLNPVTAHLAYWRDPDFYQLVVAGWLFPPAATVRGT